jgi:hypothetical protein
VIATDIKAGEFRSSTCACVDIALATKNAGVVFLENSGSGTFSTTTPDLQAPMTGTVTTLAVGQFGGNGNYGIAANLGLGFDVLLGNGSGTFTLAPGSPYAVSNTYTQCSAIVPIQRLTNASDLALRCYNVSFASVLVYLNKGTGTFGSLGTPNQTLAAGGTTSGGIAAGLLNNEPAIFAFSDSYVWNPGIAQFQSFSMDPLGTVPSGSAYAVLDNTATTAADFAVIGLTGSLTLSTFTDYSTSSYPNGNTCPASSVCGNWNSSILGPGGILASNFSQTINSGAGAYVMITAGVNTGSYASFNTYVDQRSINVFLVTFNADGTLASTNAAPIYAGTGANGYSMVPSFAAGDFANHDNGIMDLAVSGTDLASGEPTFTIYLANSSGSLPSTSSLPVVTVSGPMYSGADAVVAGKFHGPSGNTDLALFATNTLFVENGDGAGHFAVGVSYSLSGVTGYPGFVYNPSVPGEGFAPVLIATDVNGDNNTDIVLTIPENHGNCTGSPSEGAVFVFISNGDGTFKTPVFYAPPVVNPVSVTAANFYGSGHPDLVFADGGEVCGSNTPPSGLGDAAVAILQNSSGTFANPETIVSQVGDAGIPDITAVASADLDDDGSPDLVVSETGGIQVLLNNGEGGFTPSTQTQTSLLPLYSGDVTEGPSCATDYCESYVSQLTAGNFYGNYNPTAVRGSADVALAVGGVVYMFENKNDASGTLFPPIGGTVVGPSSTGPPAAILNYSSGLSDVLEATSQGTARLVNNGPIGQNQYGTTITLTSITSVITYPTAVSLTASLSSTAGTVTFGSVTFSLCPQPSGTCIQIAGIAVIDGVAGTSQTVAAGKLHRS